MDVPFPFFTIPQALDGIRLDKALALCAPDLGLRARKRLWEHYEVLVDGLPRPKGYLARAGQVLHLVPKAETPAAPAPPDPAPALTLVAATERFAALFKPAGMHSARVAGRSQDPRTVAEDQLARFWPARDVRLCNRLDQPTSGLLLVALCPEAVGEYRDLEDRGLVDKEYLSIVTGRLVEDCHARQALDQANRRKTKLLARDGLDPLRSTRATPLAHDPERDQTLVLVRIKKGARHQIRVHLAGLGHAIVGDALYGLARPGETLHLHHWRLAFPGFCAELLPDWPDVKTGGRFCTALVYKPSPS